MTNQDAVEVLSEIRSDYNFFDKNEQETYRALSMAIEALKAQLSTDDTTLDDVSNAFENGYKQGKFEAQQSQQKTGKWIQAEDIPTEYAVCTNCKGHGEFYMDYCWHCGARMEKEA